MVMRTWRAQLRFSTVGLVLACWMTFADLSARGWRVARGLGWLWIEQTILRAIIALVFGSDCFDPHQVQRQDAISPALGASFSSSSRFSICLIHPCFRLALRLLCSPSLLTPAPALPLYLSRSRTRAHRSRTTTVVIYKRLTHAAFLALRAVSTSFAPVSSHTGHFASHVRSTHSETKTSSTPSWLS